MATTATATKAASILLALSAGNIPGGTTFRKKIDLRNSPGGGLLTINTTNDAALTAQALLNIYVAHTDGATPAEGDAAWRLYATLSSTGTASGAKCNTPFNIPIGIAHLQVEVGGHTGGSLSAAIELTGVTGITST